MKMTELHSLLEQAPQTPIHIQSHHEGVYYTVEIEWQDEMYSLRGLNGKPMVFRDADAAHNLLQQAGIRQAKARRVMSGFQVISQPVFSPFQARLA